MHARRLSVRRRRPTSSTQESHPLGCSTWNSPAFRTRSLSTWNSEQRALSGHADAPGIHRGTGGYLNERPVPVRRRPHGSQAHTQRAHAISGPPVLIRSADRWLLLIWGLAHDEPASDLQKSGSTLRRHRWATEPASYRRIESRPQARLTRRGLRPRPQHRHAWRPPELLHGPFQELRAPPTSVEQHHERVHPDLGERQPR